MKRNKFLIIILLLLLGIAAYFYFTKSSSTINKSYSDFAIQDTSSIDKIFIADPFNHQVTLTKNKKGIWLVNGNHKARQPAVNNILLVAKTITVKDFVPKTAFDNVVKVLASNAIKVEFYLHHADEPQKVYYVGNATKNQLGTYMLLENHGKKSSEPFIMTLKGFNGFLAPRFFTDSSLWRDPHIFQYKPQEIKKIQVQHIEHPKESFTLLQPDIGEFILKNNTGEKVAIDTSRVNNYLIPYENVVYYRIDTTQNSTTRDSIISSTPFQIITVQDRKGKKTKIKTFHMSNYSGKIAPDGEPYPYDINMMFAYIYLPNGEKLFTTVQFVIFDNLTYNLSYLSGKSDAKPMSIGHLPHEKGYEPSKKQKDSLKSN